MEIEHFYENESFGPLDEDWFTYPQLYNSMVHRFPSGSHFVELGCWKGKSSAYMAVEILNSGKDIKFDCIDIWSDKPYDGFNMQQEFGDDLMNIFLDNIKPVSHAINVIRKDSSLAAADYADNSVDFVFVDADHSYEGVRKDIIAWFPKVKEGGILAGHDYAWTPHIRQVCNELFGEGNHTDPWNNGCFIIQKVATLEEAKNPTREL